MKKGPPTKKLKKYKKELKKILCFDHICYKSLRNANTLTELETLFLRELENRHNLIEGFSDTVNFYNFNEFINNSKVEDSILYVNYYLQFLTNYSYYTGNKKDKLINCLSFQEALGGNFLNHRAMKKLTDLFNLHDDLLGRYGFLNTFETTSWDELLDNYDNEILIFSNIQKDLKEYLKNNIEAYNKYCLLEYSEIKDNAHKAYELYYIDTFLNNEIFTDFNKTIQLLEKANLFNKYKEEIYALVSQTNANHKLKDNILEYDLSQYHYPNKITNITLNMGLSLNSLKDQLESIYNKIKKESDNSYFNFTKNYKLFTENIFTYGKNDTLRTKDKPLLENNKISLISRLFIFDSKILLADNSMIEDILTDSFCNLNIKNYKSKDSSSNSASTADELIAVFNSKDIENNKNRLWASTYSKSKYYNEILNLVKSKKYIEHATGIKS